MTEPRIHHYLSQCYLKGFTPTGRKDGQLFAINLSDGSSFRPKPANVGAERDFNRIEGLLPGALERALSGFEAEVDAALVRVRQSHSIDEHEDWNAVLNLMALFAVRNPRFRGVVRDFVEETSRLMLDMTLATPQRLEVEVRSMKAAGGIDDEPRIRYDQIKRFHEENDYRVEVPKSWHIKTELKSHDKVLRTMRDRRWLLCMANQAPGGFITSDHPVCLIHSDGTFPSFQRPVGHGLANSTVIFPLGHKLLTVGTFEGSSGVRQLSPLQVGYMNSIVYAYAERQIYARDDTFDIILGADLISGAELSRRLAAGNEETSPNLP